MKKIVIVIMFIAAMFTAACNNNVDGNDTINPGKIVSIDTVSGIPFDFGNIDTIVYVDDDETPVLHYDDPDAFDYENLAYKTGRDKWYGDYIAIDIEDEVKIAFFEDYQIYKKHNDYWVREALNETYVIEEHTIKYADGTVDIIYYVIFNEDADY